MRLLASDRIGKRARIGRDRPDAADQIRDLAQPCELVGMEGVGPDAAGEQLHELLVVERLERRLEWGQDEDGSVPAPQAKCGFHSIRTPGLRR